MYIYMNHINHDDIPKWEIRNVPLHLVYQEKSLTHTNIR